MTFPVNAFEGRVKFADFIFLILNRFAISYQSWLYFGLILIYFFPIQINYN